MFEIAADNANAIARVRNRLEGDVGYLLEASRRDQRAPFWALSRTMFPIAESIAYLLYGGNLEGETAARLSRLIREELSRTNAGYGQLASVICQVWRHGLTHADEPPFLVIDAPVIGPGSEERDFAQSRSMSWKLVLWQPDQHLSLVKATNQSAQFTFCLDRFYEDLRIVVNDGPRWSGFAVDEVKDRYNSWAAKYLDNPNPASEKGRAAQEIRALLP